MTQDSANDVVLSNVEEVPGNVVAQAAREYLDAGWNPIALSPRSKKPVRDGWQNERITADAVPATFFEDSNIGLLLGNAGNGTIDVDCDCREAIALAPAFLPSTNFIHGRPSRQRSHYWYVGNPIPPHRKFEFKGESLLELRTVGQTAAPPSIHPSGEQLAWDEADGTPPTISGDVLSRAVRELAAATLIVRHYPQPGVRHDFSLAVAGFLLRQGWDADHVGRFVTAVATVVGDDEIKDRENGVETTADRLATGGAAIGGGRLRELLGNAAFDRVCEWLGFAKYARFALPTIETTNITPDQVPLWPGECLQGDYISDVTHMLTVGTSIPPQFVREEIIAVLAALADGRLGYPLHRDLPLRRFLALISEYPQACKGESWKRVAGNTGEGGALRPLIESRNLNLLNGSGIGSGQYLAKELEEHPCALCHFDESSQLFQVTGQQSCTLLSAFKSLYESTSHWTGSFTNKKFGGDDLHLSLLLHSTRQIFLDGFALRRGVNDGLLSRFTLAYSMRTPVVPEWEPRDLVEERRLIGIIGKLVPQHHTVPEVEAGARERLLEFAVAINAPDHPHYAHTRRILELVKVDLLHRAIYSGSAAISLEMADRSIAWGEHQLALRLAFWPPDAKSEVAAMTHTLLNRLRKGRASARDLRTAANVHRTGDYETFARCLSALKKSGELIAVGKNRRGLEVYGLETDDAEEGASE